MGEKLHRTFYTDRNKVELSKGLSGGTTTTIKHILTKFYTGEQKVYFYFFKRPARYNQEVLSHSFICLPLPYMEGIVFLCNIDLYCVIAIFNGTGDMFNR